MAANFVLVEQMQENMQQYFEKDFLRTVDGMT
jgi:hypothetical protein